MDLDPKSLAPGDRFRIKESWDYERRPVGLVLSYVRTNEYEISLFETKDLRPVNLSRESIQRYLERVPPSPPTERLCDCGRPVRAGAVMTWTCCSMAGLPWCGVCVFDEAKRFHNAKHHPRVEPDGQEFVGRTFQYGKNPPRVIKSADGGLHTADGQRWHLALFRRDLAAGGVVEVPAEPTKPVEPVLPRDPVCTGNRRACPVCKRAFFSNATTDTHCHGAACLYVPATPIPSIPPNAIPACCCNDDDPGHLDPTCPLFVPPGVKPEAVCACLGIGCVPCEAKPLPPSQAHVRPTLFPEVSPKPVHHYSPSGLVGGRWSW